MGQKVNPVGLRLGLSQTWRSRWFAEGKKFADFLEEDIKIRKYIDKSLQRAAISKIEIERANKSLAIEIHTARPGIVIGKAGAEVDKLKSDLEKLIGKEVQISVKEIRRPELDAVLLAQNVSEQLVGRVPFRRAMKRAVSAALKSGAKGVKIATAGRLGGHEMARTEWYREGRVPLHTLKADIDYGYANAKTTFGSIGVKVWIYRGDVLPGVTEEEEKAELQRKLERIQAEKAAERKIEEEDLRKMEEAQKKIEEQKAEGGQQTVEESPESKVKSQEEKKSSQQSRVKSQEEKPEEKTEEKKEDKSAKAPKKEAKAKEGITAKKKETEAQKPKEEAKEDKPKKTAKKVEAKKTKESKKKDTEKEKAEGKKTAKGKEEKK